ncbi:hypothetical protein [Thioalkalivibrio sp. XN279]|uniref:hypothetical protein n=1 Tax=Thioalkalivibrio sp. XN279 TaxID=2714953 RepID=UPI00140BFB72|nr:hypothetical protein [Thioalkalivibrio sp. XN279]NHA15393.1 hypothetical protein [Thioalkalivibrio sp. XN279]
MPRTRRRTIHGQVWHITQRCHQRAFGVEAQLLWRNREIAQAGEVWCLRDAVASYRAPLEIPQRD